MTADSIRLAHNRIAENDIHIWMFDHATASVTAAELQPCLSDDEVERAGRFYTKELQERFILARGFLRQLLGKYLNSEPGVVRFHYGDHGKPEIAHASGHHPLRFNLAHSGSIDICAVTLNRSIGLDLEQIRTVTNLEQICKRFFSMEESAKLLRLPENERHQLFFSCWTAKEAFIKATGEGLSRALDSFMVSFLPDEESQIQIRADNGWIVSPWTLWHLETVAGYRAALVADKASEAMLSIHNWPDQSR